MKVLIDVVIGHHKFTLDEIMSLNKGQIKNIDDFIQSQVMLKSGNQVIAIGTLIKVDDQFAVSIDEVNDFT